MKHKWQPTKRTDDLTITIFARNLITLHYPFVESFISTLSLGCRYLVGSCSTDGTEQVFKDLAKYAPIDIINFDWPLDKEPGWGAVAIGICTQRTIEKSPTEYVLNVQACEIFCEDAIARTLDDHPWVPPGAVGPREYRFRHFYGSMNHGGPGYGGYPHAPRLFKRDTKIDRTDGWVPNEYCGGFPVAEGWINRYGYCWINTIHAKMHNKVKLYWQAAEPQIQGTLALRQQNIWDGGHPLCVQHLIDRENYDVNYSLDYAKAHLLS